jgi:hypothetical protein
VPADLVPEHLKAGFAGKRCTRILDCTRICPLQFNPLLAFSCLVRYARHGKGATAQQIHRATGLQRSQTVAAAIQVLAGHGLAARVDGYWHAVEPAGETAGWFPVCKNTVGRAWPARLAYWWLVLPSPASPLTAKQNAVYCNLLDPCCERQAGLVRMLKLDKKTVATALAELRRLGLVSETELRANPPAADQLGWWADKPKQKAFRASAGVDDWSRFSDGEDVAAILDRFGRDMLDAGYSEADIRAYWRTVKDLGNNKVFYAFMTGHFSRLFEKVEADHAANRAAGKYGQARNSHGLLRTETRKVIARLRKRLKCALP